MPGNRTGDEPRVLKACLLPMVAPAGVNIVRVDAAFARHHWPGQASAEWRANPGARTARRGDSLFVQGQISIVG